MQAVVRVRQHLLLAPAEALGELGTEHLAHVARRRCLAGCVLVALMDVVVGHLREGGIGVVEAGRGHPPGADRRAEQVHPLRAACQPLAEDETVQRVEYQPFRAAGRGRHGAHIGTSQAVFLQMLERARAGMDVECLHARGC